MLRLRRKKENQEEPEVLVAEIPASEVEQETAVEENIDEIEENAVPEEEIAREEGITEEFRATVEGFAAERGLEASELEAGINVLNEIGEGWKNGELTVDMLGVVLRGLEYESAVAQAREEGEIAGRNKQIDEKYMHPVESDGIPYLGGSALRKNAGRVASIFDLARKA